MVDHSHRGDGDDAAAKSAQRCVQSSSSFIGCVGTATDEPVPSRAIGPSRAPLGDSLVAAMRAPPNVLGSQKKEKRRGAVYNVQQPTGLIGDHFSPPHRALEKTKGYKRCCLSLEKKIAIMICAASGPTHNSHFVRVFRSTSDPFV